MVGRLLAFLPEDCTFWDKTFKKFGCEFRGIGHRLPFRVGKNQNIRFCRNTNSTGDCLKTAPRALRQDWLCADRNLTMFFLQFSEDPSLYLPGYFS